MLVASMSSGCLVQHVDVTPADAAVVVDTDDVTRLLAGFTPDPSAVTLGKQRLPGGTTRITYEYDAPEGDLYMLCDVYAFADDAQAEKAFGSFSRALRSVFDGEREVSLAGLEPASIWQDRSKLFVLVRDERPVGNAFISRQGPKLLQLVIFGLFFEDPEALRVLVSPKLVALWGYRTRAID